MRDFHQYTFRQPLHVLRYYLQSSGIPPEPIYLKLVALQEWTTAPCDELSSPQWSCSGFPLWEQCLLHCSKSVRSESGTVDPPSWCKILESRSHRVLCDTPTPNFRPETTKCAALRDTLMCDWLHDTKIYNI